MVFPSGSVVKNPPTNAGDKVQSLSQEDPLEKEMATHSSILAWRIPGTGEPGGLQSMESQRDRHDLATERKHEAYLYRKLKRFIGKIKINKEVYKVIRNKIYIQESIVYPSTAYRKHIS